MCSLPYSQACENNKGPILDVLSRVFVSCRDVLELASGTGQHATWFSAQMPFLQWQPTETAQHIEILNPRCSQYSGANLLPPKALDVSDRPWPVEAIPDALFSANSLHIMPWSSVEALFGELGDRARANTLLVIYGPFNYGGQYTSPSNAQFDQRLAQQSPVSAIRDFEKVNALASNAGFELREDIEMPANNRLLVWRKG